MALAEKQIEGKYEILDKISEGGMGAVYKVRHRFLDEIRVVKVIRANLEPNPELSRRFLREAQLANRLRHPNIAALHDFAIGDDGNAFIVMEFIAGLTLERLLRAGGPPAIGLTLEIARQALAAMGYLHRHGFVHRDIAPDNLMLTRGADGGPLVKLIDLGIAKVLTGDSAFTSTGIFLGKPRYASPEHFGTTEIDGRSDLYSFGVVLYELLTGQCPVVGRDPASYMAGHLFRAPLGFGETDPGGRVPRELRLLVLRILAKRPEERFASAEELGERIAALQGRIPARAADLDAALALGAGGPAPGEPPPAAGSSQQLLNREFGPGTTPPPGARALPPAAGANVIPAWPQQRPAAAVPPPRAAAVGEERGRDPAGAWSAARTGSAGRGDGARDRPGGELDLPLGPGRGLPRSDSNRREAPLDLDLPGSTAPPRSADLLVGSSGTRPGLRGSSTADAAPARRGGTAKLWVLGLIIVALAGVVVAWLYLRPASRRPGADAAAPSGSRAPAAARQIAPLPPVAATTASAAAAGAAASLGSAPAAASSGSPSADPDRRRSRDRAPALPSPAGIARPATLPATPPVAAGASATPAGPPGGRIPAADAAGATGGRAAASAGTAGPGEPTPSGNAERRSQAPVAAAGRSSGDETRPASPLSPRSAGKTPGTPPRESPPGSGRDAGRRRRPPAAAPQAEPAPVETIPGLLVPGPGFEAAEPLEIADAVYPEAARGSGRQPHVLVAVLIDERGSVIAARVKSGDSSRLGFDEAALDAARRSRFLPARKDGVRGKAWSELMIEFIGPPAK